MTRRNSSLGFLGRFGRSEDLRNLDMALRAADLHPAQVPEGVKLTIVNLMKDQWPHGEPPIEAYGAVGRLFAYCLIGPDLFRQANGDEAVQDAERRIELALDREASLDAQLVLLSLHAKLVNPKVLARFDLSAE